MISAPKSPTDDCAAGWIEDQGSRFRCQAKGDGPALAIGHAITRDLTQASRYLGRLTGCRLVTWNAFDEPHRSSLRVRGPTSFEQLSARLRCVLDHFDIDEAVVGGISMGAGTAANFAVRMTHRVRGLILIRPAWLVSPCPLSLRPLQLMGEMLLQHSPSEAKHRFLATDEFRQLTLASSIAAEEVVAQFDDPNVQNRARLLAEMPAAAPLPDWDAASRIRVPALVVGSEQDVFHPMDVARQWAERLPNAKLAVVPSAVISPAEHFSSLLAAVQRFLTKLSIT
jgi:pimeloyl-ACP methyl ester carboxylesterase